MLLARWIELISVDRWLCELQFRSWLLVCECSAERKIGVPNLPVRNQLVAFAQLVHFSPYLSAPLNIVRSLVFVTEFPNPNSTKPLLPSPLAGRQRCVEHPTTRSEEHTSELQ